jgi:hypothetical protein
MNVNTVFGHLFTKGLIHGLGSGFCGNEETLLLVFRGKEEKISCKKCMLF